MVYPGGPNYVQLFPSNDEKNLCYGSLHQPSMGECIMGEGDLVDPPPEKFPEVGDEESDEDIDIEELERRMWRDRMRLKCLKEQQQNKNKEQGDVAKQWQSQEQARRKKMSRAQDGILKYMLKMMEVCKAQGFVYGIIPEKGKPVSGASDNLRGWWKEKVRFDRNGPAAIANGLTGAISFNTSSGDYDVEGVDEDKSEDVILHNPPADGNTFSLNATVGNEKFVLSVPMKDETDCAFIQKRTAAEPELLLNQRIYTCDNAKCPHHDFCQGFTDRNARNSHQYLCKYQNTFPQSISALSAENFPVNENKPPVLSMSSTAQPTPTSLGSSLNPINVSDLGIPSDGQKSINELMGFYDNNISGDKSLTLGSASVLEGSNSFQSRIQMEDTFFGQETGMGGSLFEEVGSFVQQPQFFVREDMMPFGQQFSNQPNESSGGFRFTSGLNMPAVDYSNAASQRGVLQKKHDGSSWFY
ncbi:hypothetical protein B296_00012025 [Ensete ventricosum]|uniref:Ethylene insensitive 3-like DNA-binding domain-containing protein n=1 Tax=Ensete ventricosum TaxID=4639 RepID=A0A427ASB3_ENSVE|nr:hypothetical protein B296_00012025 [Ensete ventricosum]